MFPVFIFFYCCYERFTLKWILNDKQRNKIRLWDVIENAPVRVIEPRPRRWERRILTTRPHEIRNVCQKNMCIWNFFSFFPWTLKGGFIFNITCYFQSDILASFSITFRNNLLEISQKVYRKFKVCPWQPLLIKINNLYWSNF